jgi:cysteine desulfurase/selenocysteine lyase
MMIKRIENNTVDFAAVRADFPLLHQTNRGKPIVYLDSAASAQKPKSVIEAIRQFYQNDYANIHRGIYELSERSSELYENTRAQVRQFINAAQKEEIVFVRGTTEAINLVAACFSKNALGQTRWQVGDEIILSEMEHHANIVPWYLLKEQIGLVLKIIPISDEGAMDINAYQQLFSSRTKMVALSHVSNALGTINPVKEMIRIAHAHQVPVLLDGAQAIPHVPVDVQDLDCDFYAFSAHKMYAPTGIGVLYAKHHLLDQMPPYQGGGDMIETVSFSRITFAKAPHKFEAGTPDIAGVIGLSAAIHYVHAIGMQNIFVHEQQLLDYAESALLALPSLRIIGTAKPKVGVISFVLPDVHPHDIGTVLDHEGIAVRAGHHCAMPLMERMGVPATVRASFGVYTNEQDIDALVQGIQLAQRLFH